MPLASAGAEPVPGDGASMLARVRLWPVVALALLALALHLPLFRAKLGHLLLGQMLFYGGGLALLHDQVARSGGRWRSVLLPSDSRAWLRSVMTCVPCLLVVGVGAGWLHVVVLARLAPDVVVRASEGDPLAKLGAPWTTPRIFEAIAWALVITLLVPLSRRSCSAVSPSRSCGADGAADPRSA